MIPRSESFPLPDAVQTSYRPASAHRIQNHRADIDGLRAFAVLAVMLCHAGFKEFAGGFIGVDVFFTISGFVVTNSILRELDQGRFSLADFYARRARRLGPALYLVLAVTFLFSLLFRFPDDTFQLAKNMLAVATFTSNVYCPCSPTSQWNAKHSARRWSRDVL